MLHLRNAILHVTLATVFGMLTAGCGAHEASAPPLAGADGSPLPLPANCGDDTIDAHETCEVSLPTGAAGACPTSCDDGDQCTTDTLEGAGTCQAACIFRSVRTCLNGDGCCASGCDATTDDDCSKNCGNGSVDSGETCDTKIPSGEAGQLGDKSASGSSTTPVEVIGIRGLVESVHTSGYSQYGMHSCAKMKDRTLKCWGSNKHGQVGDGTTAPALEARDVLGLSQAGTDVRSVAIGLQHTCVIDGTQVRCWGSNTYGQLGIGAPTSAMLPQTVLVDGTPLVASKVTTGAYHACAMTPGGKLFCWGRNWYGEAGLDASVSLSRTPSQIFATGVTDVACGMNFTCAIHHGKTKCWGLNSNGQVGLGLEGTSSTPVMVKGL